MANTSLKEVFYSLAASYTDADNTAALWSEIETAYTKKRRYYHTTQHLENLIQQLIPVKQEISDWDVLLFAVYYHDIVYSIIKKDNEEKSALFAKKRLDKTTISKERIERCVRLILATKQHECTTDPDIDLFTDADLSVLGAPAAIYKNYAINVRKEYYIYPDSMYKPGRKKVLEHFLSMDRIYKTRHFFALFEAQARINLQAELTSL